MLTWLGLAILAPACASTHKILAPADTSSGSDTGRLRKGTIIVGYTTRDGVHHSFSGTVQLLDGSWHFMPHVHGNEPFTLPADQVASLDVVRSTRLSGLAVVLLPVALVVLFLYLTGPGGIDGLN